MKTQQEKVLALLKHAGISGINSYDLTYVHSVKQAPTRIKELKEEGHLIVTRQHKDRSVDYILVEEKKEPPQSKKPLIIFKGNTAIVYKKPVQENLF